MFDPGEERDWLWVMSIFRCFHLIARSSLLLFGVEEARLHFTLLFFNSKCGLVGAPSF